MMKNDLVKLDGYIEVRRPLECYMCKQYLSKINFSCPYFDKGGFCPTAEDMVKSVLEKLHIIEKEK